VGLSEALLSKILETQENQLSLSDFLGRLHVHSIDESLELNAYFFKLEAAAMLTRLSLRLIQKYGAKLR